MKLISSKFKPTQIKYTRTLLIDNSSLRKITVALAAISKPSKGQCTTIFNDIRTIEEK